MPVLFQWVTHFVMLAGKETSVVVFEASERAFILAGMQILKTSNVANAVGSVIQRKPFFNSHL